VNAALPNPAASRRITTKELVDEYEAKLKDLRAQLAAEEAEEKRAREEAENKKGK
jgi:hypothetical protein